MTALLAEHLPLLAGAPNGIKKLRELILKLAVRGRLVPVELQADSEVPVGWISIKLGEKLTFEYGDNLPAAKRSNTGEYPVYGSNGVVGSHDKYFVKGPCIVIGRKGSAGALHLCVASGCCVTDVAYYCVPPEDLSLEYTFKILQTLGLDELGKGIKPGLSRKDAYELEILVPPLAEQHRIVAKVDELMALCDTLEAQHADAESAHAHLVQALLDSLTQASDAQDFAAHWQRLSAHFDTLFTTGCSIDAFKQALLQLAVMGKLVPQCPGDEPAAKFVERIRGQKQRDLTDGKFRKQKDLDADSLPESPYEVPSGWEWTRVDHVLHVTGGVALGRKFRDRHLVSKPYLRVANVQRGHLEMHQVKEVEIPENEVEKHLLQRGDLLITEGGDWDKVGRTAIWREELPECLHQNHVFRARSVIPDWEARWAELYLNSTPAMDYFAGSSKQTTNLASINMTQLRACAFPLPPLAEQHRIVAKVDELMALCDQLKTRLRQARDLNQQLATTLVERAVA